MTNNERAVRAGESFRRLLRGPIVPEPTPIVLPPQASETDRLLGQALYRLDQLELQNRLMLKVVWRTSAALVGLVSAGPLKDWAVVLMNVLGG